MTYSILVICMDASAGSSPVSQFVSILGLATCNKNETQDRKQQGTYLIISCWTFLFNLCFQFQICQSQVIRFHNETSFLSRKVWLSNRSRFVVKSASSALGTGLGRLGTTVLQTCSTTPTTFFSGLKKRRFKKANTKKMWIEEGDASRSRANS